MRKSWFLFAALAPLAATPALAATTVDNALTTPIATSTAGDITVSSTGSVTGPDTTPVVTIDSSNTLTNAGTIQANNISGATGVLIQGGNAGGFTHSGSILLNEDYAASDTNGDGVVEGPFAQGSGKTGVRLIGPSPFVGDIISSSGGVSVEGNDSKGYSIEGALQGSLVVGGSVSVVGDRGVGVNVAAPVSGVVRITGPVTVTGMGSTAIDISGDVAGSLTIYNTVTATGYGTTARPTTVDILNKVQATASEVEQGGVAVHVGASLGGGLFLGSPPPGTTADSSGDADGDGIPDNAVGAGSITSYGSAPAVLIGAAGRTVDLGKFGSGDNAYGVVLRGAVSGSGVYDGVTATGMQIGGVGGTVNIAGGVRVFGSLGASAFDASATGLRIGAGATVPELRVENLLSATVNHSAVVTTAASGSATAVLIEAGGSLPTLTNLGGVTAAATGDGVTATAVLDQSGTLSTIVNQGNITAGVAPATTGLSVAGKAVALDLRANTTGVTITQSVNTSPITLAQSTAGTVTSPTAPSIVGDVLLGSGPNTVNLNGGIMVGALDLGSGAATFNVNNGATYKGELRHSGPSLAIAVNAGNLYSSNAHVLQATSLTVGATGVLSFAIDPQAGTAGGLQVSGPATFADGAKLGLSLNSILTQPQSFTLIRANSLSVGAGGIGLIADQPYVVDVSLRTDVAAGTVTLDLHRRTAAEAGFNAGETAAYDAVYSALSLDAGIQGALLGETTRDGFMGLYRQMIPEYAGGVFRLARAGAEATARSATEASNAAGSIWVQETGFGVDSSKADAASYRGGGFGLIAGMDGPEGGLGRLGATLSFMAGGIQDPDSASDGLESFSEFEAGLHWRLETGGLRLDARGSAGLVSYKSKREFLQTDTAGTALVQRNATGKSNGYALSGRFGVGYEFGTAWLTVRPQAHVDYFRLSRKSYSETGGGDGFDLNFGERTGSMTSATGSVVFTGGLGKSHSLHPSLELGYRQGLSGSAGTTTASFKGGTEFDLDAPTIKGQGAGVARIGLKSSKEYFDLSLTAGAEARADYLEGDLQFRVRLAF